MRLTINEEEIKGLSSVLKDETIDFEKHKLDNKTLLKKIEDEQSKPTAKSKQIAAATARDIRVKQTKEKIANTINMMRMKDKKINLLAISQESGVSYSTVHKYKDFVESLIPLDSKK